MTDDLLGSFHNLTVPARKLSSPGEWLGAAVEYGPGEIDFDDKRHAGTFFQSSNDYIAIYSEKCALQARGSVHNLDFERQSMFDLNVMKMCNPKDQVEETVEGSARCGGATYMFIGLVKLLDHRLTGPKDSGIEPPPEHSISWLSHTVIP